MYTHCILCIECTSEEFACASDDQCVPAYGVCDRAFDCIDSSDESGCNECMHAYSFYNNCSSKKIMPSLYYTCEIISYQVLTRDQTYL